MSHIIVQMGIAGEETLTDYAAGIRCRAMQHGIDMPVVANTADRTEGASVHGSILLEHEVDNPTEVAGDDADQGPEHRREEGGAEPELHGALRPEEDARQEVAAEVVRAQGVIQAGVLEPLQDGRLEGVLLEAVGVVLGIVPEEHLVLVVGRDVRADHTKAENDDADDEGGGADLLRRQEAPQGAQDPDGPGRLFGLFEVGDPAGGELRGFAHAEAPSTVTRGSMTK